MGAGDDGAGGGVELAKTIMLPYLQRADELQKHDPLVAYYCRLYAMERGLKVPAKERSKTMNALLLSLMNQLEKDKKTVKLSPDDNLHVEGFALGVFSKADKQDRAGRGDLNTAKTFYASSIFFEILTQFGDLQPEIEQKQKYAVWKAADIRKALSEGRKPEPGPPGGDAGFSLDDVFSEQELLTGEAPRAPSPPANPKTSIDHTTSTAAYYSSSATAPSQLDHTPPPPPPPPPPPETSFYSSNSVEHFQNAPEHFPQSDRWETSRTNDYPMDSGYQSATYPSSGFYPSSSAPFSQQHPGSGDYHSPPSYPCFTQPGGGSFQAPTINPASSYQQAPAAAAAAAYQQQPVYEPPPLPRTSSAPPLPELEKNYKPPPEKITEAHKASRFAVSALAFDDVPTAISYLRRSLELLTSPSAS